MQNILKKPSVFSSTHHTIFPEFDDKNLSKDSYFVRDAIIPQPVAKNYSSENKKRNFRFSYLEENKKSSKNKKNLFSFCVTRTEKSKLDPSKVYFSINFHKTYEFFIEKSSGIRSKFISRL